MTVVKPTVPKEDRAEVLRKATSRLSAKVAAYPACRPGVTVGPRWENEGMTHDPLCPVGVKPWEDAYCCQRCNSGETPPWERACQCDLIAKVRADQDRIHREEMQSLVLAARKERP